MDTDLKFPVLDEPIQTPPAEAARAPDVMTLAVQQFAPMKASARMAVVQLKGLVLDLSTQAKVDEAKSLRWRLVGQPLADVRRVAKNLKSALTATSKKVGEEMEAIERVYDEADKLITPAIEAREAELAAAREEARRVERERVEGLQAKLAALSKWAERCTEPGMTSLRIAEGIKVLNGMELDAAEWQEFLGRALVRRAEVVEEMRAHHQRKLAAEMEAQRLEQERAELDRQRTEIRLALSMQRAIARVGVTTVGDALPEVAGRTELLTPDEMNALADKLDALQPAAAGPAIMSGGIHAPVARPEFVESEDFGVLAVESAVPPQDSRSQESGALTDPHATGNGNMAHTSGDAAPAAGPAEGEGASAPSPGSCDHPSSDAKTPPPLGGSGLVTTVIEPAAGWWRGSNHAEESGSSPADAPAAVTTATCATGEAASAHALPDSGDEGAAARADTSAAGPIALKGPDPEDDDEGGIDLLMQCIGLVEVLRKPYSGRFQSHPKPGPDWWADVRARIDSLEPKLLMAAAIKKGA